MGAYGVTVAGLSAAVRVSGRGLPDRLVPNDLALVSVATHKLARLLTKDPVTSPPRAPFTSFDGTSGEAELAEQVRGSGPRKAVGELLTCPFCLGQWFATSFVYGLILALRPTRLAATGITAVTGADFLHLAYAKVQAWAT